MQRGPQSISLCKVQFSFVVFVVRGSSLLACEITYVAIPWSLEVFYACMCMHVCVRACVYACVRACVRVCVCAFNDVCLRDILFYVFTKESASARHCFLVSIHHISFCPFSHTGSYHVLFLFAASCAKANISGAILPSSQFRHVQVRATFNHFAQLSFEQKNVL